MLKIAGWNDFYEGWIDSVFEQPRNPEMKDNNGYQCGYDTASDSKKIPGLLFRAFLGEIIAGHVIVEHWEVFDPSNPPDKTAKRPYRQLPKRSEQETAS
jgi:hypothetical protein